LPSVRPFARYRWSIGDGAVFVGAPDSTADGNEI
jgi:hypothetical protein